MFSHAEIGVFAIFSIAVSALMAFWPSAHQRRHALARIGPVSFDPSSRRVHSLDGLRAVSALLVMASHLGLKHVVPGGLGVTCFFFISGFLITRLLLAEIDRSGSIDLAGFYRRRFWRLWPAIAVAVVGVVLIGAAFGEVWAPPGHAVTSLLFLQNYWSFLAPGSNPLNIQWSLAIEFHFYLIWPIALLSRPGLAVPAVAAALLGFLALRVWTVVAFKVIEMPDNDIAVWTYKLTHLRGDILLFGCLLALAAYDRRWRGSVQVICKQRSIWLGLVILLTTLALREETFRATARYSIQGVGLFMIFAGVLFAERGGLVRWTLNRPIMIWLGAISFSIYLWHMTLWRAVRQATGQDRGVVPALITVALTALIAWLSHRFVEHRFIDLGRRPPTAATPSPRYMRFI